jgi:hypothetical protein
VVEQQMNLDNITKVLTIVLTVLLIASTARALFQ